MQYKKGQVEVLANTNTNREIFVDLQDVVLNPGAESEIKLGDYLKSLEKTGKDNQKDIKKLKKTIQELTLAVSKVNLK